MEDKHERDTLALLRRCRMDEDRLRALYVAVREGIREGKTFREKRGPALWLSKQMGIPAGAAEAGLRVLSELSLVRCLDDPPYLIFEGNGARVSLEDSAAYRRLCGFMK